MRYLKRIGGLILSFMMIFALTVPAFAADITIKGGAANSEYAAYRLLNLTTSDQTGGGTNYAYTVNPKYEDVLKEVTGQTDESGIVNYISGLNAEDVRTFADTVYGKAKTKGLAADYTTTSDTLAGVDQGYYMIIETKTGDQPDAYSLVMLNTAGKENLEVQTKESVPTVEKKVEEKNDSTGATEEGVVADYDIGDAVPFLLTGTMPTNLDAYATYKYVFHDTLSAGLIYQDDAAVYLVNGGTETLITGEFTINATADGDQTKLEISDDNIKTITGITKDSSIVVKYTAELKDSAVIGGAGNENKVKLEFSNDPYDDGTGNHTGETPESKVTVFTFQAIINKIKKDKSPLDGAGFSLYKWDASVTAADKYVQVGTEMNGMTTFTFKGLDAGKYKLVESTVPEGYNKADDLEFTVERIFDGQTLDSLVVKDKNNIDISTGDQAVFTINLAEGSFSTNVVNLSGTELPSTGGSGTAIFYILGSILALGAIVLLVTRKRMGNK